jgi:hypothetical protein
MDTHTDGMSNRTAHLLLRDKEGAGVVKPAGFTHPNPTRHVAAAGVPTRGGRHAHVGESVEEGTGVGDAGDGRVELSLGRWRCRW